MRKLRVLCPQEYEGMDMRVTPCTRCDSGWNPATGRCDIYVGVEHRELVPPSQVRQCPIQDKCQHQIQASAGLCAVRARGMICESALTLAGVADVWALDYAFHASTEEGG